MEAERLLVVDDEQDIRRLLRDFFELQGYQVYTAASGKEALDKLAVQPDLILLDINMPDMDGMEVCRNIRDHVTCPIVFLTARVEEQDRINGLMIGGDDYIMKPFAMEELGARVAAHLRRERRGSIRENVAFHRGLVIHYGSRQVYFSDQPVNLTRTEFDLVEFLSMHRGQVFGRERIYELVWGYDKEGDSQIITEHIRRVRQKFRKFTEEEFIETVWGVGYKWIG